MNYKDIIPSLVSLETNLTGLPGFYLSGDFDFYPGVKRPNKFHFKIFNDDTITPPRNYDFRNGYFKKSAEVWYYERKLGPVRLAFTYNPKEKTFYYNQLYRQVPFEVGFIFPLGRHIADIINLQLFLSGYILFRGCSFQFKGENYCVMAPAFNGKTTLVTEVLEKGGKYISEDVLVINFLERKIYPHSVISNNGREANKTLSKTCREGNFLKKPVKIDNLYLVQNSTNFAYQVPSKGVFDYFYLNSLFFLNNPFIKSYVFTEGWSEKIFSLIQKMKTFPINSHFVHVQNFDFSKIFDI